MREDWVEVELGEVGKVVSGGTPKTSVPEYWGEDIPWITPADLSGYNGKYISIGRKSITREGLKNSSAKLMPAHSVLYSSRAPIGYVAIAKNELATNQGFKSLVPYKVLLPEYVYYHLKALKNIADKNASGTTFKELSAKGFSKLPLKIAPLPEQRAIVAKIEKLFSELDNAIANLKATKDKLEIYHQAVLKKAFEGEFSSKPLHYCRLGEYTSIISGHAFKKSEYTTEGVPLFQIANVSFNKIIWDKKAFLPMSYLSDKKLSKLILKEGDIVVALNRPMLNNKLKIGQLAKIDTPAILYQRVGKFILNNDLNSKYLLYYLQSPKFTKWLSEELRGVNIPFINQTKLLNYDLFPITEMCEQNQIVQEIETRLSVCDNIQASIDEGLKKAEALRQSILKKAFEGRLLTEKELEACRREPDWEPADKLLKKIKKPKEEGA